MRSFIRLPFNTFLLICKLFPTFPKFPIPRSAPLIPFCSPCLFPWVQSADMRRQGVASQCRTGVTQFGHKNELLLIQTHLVFFCDGTLVFNSNLYLPFMRLVFKNRKLCLKKKINALYLFGNVTSFINDLAFKLMLVTSNINLVFKCLHYL